MVDWKSIAIVLLLALLIAQKWQADKLAKVATQLAAKSSQDCQETKSSAIKMASSDHTLPKLPVPSAGECDMGFYKRGNLCYATFIVYEEGSFQASNPAIAMKYMKSISDEVFEEERPWFTDFMKHHGLNCKDFRHIEPGLCICAKSTRS